MLKKNIVLSHLSIKDCKELTNQAVAELLDVVSFFNLVIFDIQLTPNQFDKKLATQLITVSWLNRSITQHLKPKLIVTAKHKTLGFLGEETEKSCD